MYDTPGETTGYPFPRPFQPNIKARLKKPIAKGRKSVINRSKGSKPIVKKKFSSKNKAGK